MVRTTQPNFYSEYQKVRKVIETGIGSLALKIKTINAQTGEPEANVTLTLSPVNGTLKSAAANQKVILLRKLQKAVAVIIKALLMVLIL